MNLLYHLSVAALFLLGVGLAYTDHEDAAILVFAGACLVVLIREKEKW